jgi:hypothetical protein
MAVVAAIVSGGAQAIKAYKQMKGHEAQAEAYRQAKNRRMGATTREMSEERRKQAFIHSRAVAVAAASGAGTDAGMVKLLADLNAEGEYRVMSVLWQGQNDAEGLIHQAEAEEQAADDALIMGVINTVASAFSTYSSAGGSFGGSSTVSAPTASKATASSSSMT